MTAVCTECETRKTSHMLADREVAQMLVAMEHNCVLCNATLMCVPLVDDEAAACDAVCLETVVRGRSRE